MEFSNHEKNNFVIFAEIFAEILVCPETIALDDSNFCVFP